MMLLLLLFLLLGWLHSGQALQVPEDERDIVHHIREKTTVRLTGTLLTMPEYNGENTRLLLAADGLRKADWQGFQKIHGQVQLTLYDAPDPELAAGSRLLLRATVDRVHDYQTPGSTRHQLLLASRNIHITGWIGSKQEIMQARHNASRSLRFLPQQWRQQIGYFVSSHLQPESAALYRALLIGDRSAVSPAVLETFKNTGTMHILAISGLHMSLLALMSGGLLYHLLRRSTRLMQAVHIRTAAALCSLPVLVFYGAIAGFGLPALRALVMACLVLLALTCRREYAISHIISAAALLLVTSNPLALFTVSFQLTFAAVLGLASILPHLERMWIPASNQPNGTPPHRLRDKVKAFILSALLVSLAATLATLPLLLFHFNRFSPIGIVLNVLVEPLLCFWALPLGLAAIPCITVLPELAAWLLKLGSAGIFLAQEITARASSLPLASLWTITPTLVEIIVYYVLILLLLVCKSSGPQLLASAGGFCLLLHFTAGLWFPYPEAVNSRISVLDVGQGNAALLELPDRSTAMIDCGGTFSPRFDPGERIIAPFLWKQRIWRLDTLVITHPHSDHFAGASFLLDHFSPATIWINGDQGDPGYKELLAKARQLGVQIRRAKSGQELIENKRVRLRCHGIPGLSGEGLEGLSVNNRSLVLRFTDRETDILFPGDIEKKSEGILMENGQALPCEVLLAAHHGSITSNSPAMMKYIQPQWVLVSASRNKQAIYPHPQRLREWEQQGSRVAMTYRDGTITCITDGYSMRMRTFCRHRTGNPFRTAPLTLQ